MGTTDLPFEATEPTPLREHGSERERVGAQGLADEPHGSLIRFAYSRFSHGMMMGSSSSSGDELNWNRDGSVILTSSCSGGGESTRLEYRVRPESAEKVRSFVAEKRLAALSKQEIPTPAVFDNFTSSSFHMTFDDRALGGSPYESLHINCGPAGMVFRKLEDEAWELLKECRETGECIARKEEKVGGAFGGMMGLPGMMDGSGAMGGSAVTAAEFWTCPNCGHAGNTGAFCAACAAARPAAKSAETADAAPARPVEPLPPGGWTCSNCGHAGNTGRFCPECGCPR